jgi:hypothetical protein
VGSSMRVTKASAARACAICERTLLMGEYALRFSPDGSEYVDVCPLCQEVALEQGWVREGVPISPALQQPLRRRRSLLSSILGTRPVETEPVVSEPILRRLTDDELALVEVADLFNASQFRRTITGVSKALGDPRVSIMPLSGVNSEMIVTFAWDISWYQYRVQPEAAQPVRIEERGHDINDLDSAFTEWNARLDERGRLMPDIERL